MNRVLVVFSDELLAQVDAARGLASRSAWIRSWCEHGVRVENEWPAVEEAVAPLVPVELVERDGVSMAIARRGVRPEDIVIPEPKPKARRKKLADPPGTHRDKSIASAERRMAIKSGLIPPDRCNRGACTGTINPVSGRCLHCNQTPLKESK